MNPLTTVSRGFPHRLVGFLLALAAGAAPGMVSPAAPQVAPGNPQVTAVSRLTLLRTGTFETWQDTTCLGTEFYRVYISPKRDSLITAATVRYTLHNHGGTTNYEKVTVGVSRALDSYPVLYQSHEQIGARSRSISVLTRDTTATIYRESEGVGQGRVIAVPPGRLYVLDPSVYQHVESVVADFYAQGAASRVQNVLMTPRDTVVQVRLARGNREAIEVPGRGKVQATRVDVYDDLTLIQAWVDDQGLLLQVLAPKQKIRVVRLPPGQAEADAAAEAKGAPITAR